MAQHRIGFVQLLDSRADLSARNAQHVGDFFQIGFQHITGIILTMLICAAVVGWQAVRISVVTELADIADAIAALDQSYSFSGFQGHAAVCAGSAFDDERDFCDDDDCVQVAEGFGRCIALVDPPKENNSIGGGSGGGVTNP